MASKKNFDYFGFFRNMIVFATDAASYLYTTMSEFDHTCIEKHVAELHEIEHSADRLKHTVTEQLVKEFLPPIDREDIVKLSHVLDDCVDCIEDVILRLYMFDIRCIRPEALPFADNITLMCRELSVVFASFEKYKKTGAEIRKHIIEVHHLEESGDKLYAAAMRSLFNSGASACELASWKEIYDRLEKCCDTCEHVADVAEEVILKNS